MSNFRYFHPIEIRYSDLDPQGHVNNAVYLTYFEQARIGYIRRLDLWQVGSWLDVGIILADARLTFQAPVLYGQQMQVGVRVSRLGNKSLTMEYCLQEVDSGRDMATGSTVLVTYDYRQNVTIPIPENWRKAIQQFEGIGEA